MAVCGLQFQDPDFVLRRPDNKLRELAEEGMAGVERRSGEMDASLQEMHYLGLGSPSSHDLSVSVSVVVVVAVFLG